MLEGYNESPLNRLPAVVWLLVLPVLAMEIVVQLGALGLAGGAAGVGWRSEAIQRFALSPQMLGYMYQSGQWLPDFLMRFVTYPVVHQDFMQTVFSVVILMALGKMVGEVFRPWAVLAVFFGASILAALIYSLIPGLEAPLIGAWPGRYGLIGAFTFILWARLGAVNANRFRAFSLIGTLLGIQLVFGILFGGNAVWIADIAGFVIGFAISFLVAPGGPGYLLRLLRQR